MPLMTLQTNVPLKFIHCLWYIITVWNSPLLRYVYHFMYHSNPVNNTNELECPANGVGIRCIVLQDSREYRHLCFLSEAYKLVKKSQQELLNPNCMDMKLPTGKANNNEANIRMQKCLQTLKGMLSLSFHTSSSIHHYCIYSTYNSSSYTTKKESETIQGDETKSIVKGGG